MQRTATSNGAKLIAQMTTFPTSASKNGTAALWRSSSEGIAYASIAKSPTSDETPATISDAPLLTGNPLPRH